MTTASYETSTILLSRLKRFNYEDTHEWPDDDNMEYDFDENGREGEDLTLWEEIGMNWQKVGKRLIFISGFVCFFLMMFLCCGKILCRTCCHSLKGVIIPCQPALDLCTSWYQDPMYKKAKEFSDLFGIKLDYATFLKLKEKAETQAEGPNNPFGFPQMA